MLQKFYPDEYRESAYGLDYEGLRGQGYKGIIFDIDNTLVPHGAPADEKSIALFWAAARSANILAAGSQPDCR